MTIVPLLFVSVSLSFVYCSSLLVAPFLLLSFSFVCHATLLHLPLLRHAIVVVDLCLPLLRCVVAARNISLGSNVILVYIFFVCECL